VIHDEILVECPEGISHELAQVVKKAMEDAGARYYTRVPLTAQPVISKQWVH
jgi:DNA polymerase I-like protein with 3'-5' exonuclease and polymerase domains